MWPRMARTSASLLALLVMKLRSLGGMVGEMGS